MNKKKSASPTPKNFDPDEVLARLLQLSRPAEDAVPADYHTTKEWSVMLDKSPARSAVLLKAGVEAGEVDKIVIRTGNDVRLTPYYKWLGVKK